MGVTEAKLEAPRARIEVPEGHAEWVIPVGKNWFFILFLPIWLAGWAAGEMAVAWQIATHFAPFLAIWLVFWTAAGLVVMATLAWQFRGREIIRIDGDRLIHGCRGFGWKRDIAYRLSEIRGLAADRGPAFWERYYAQTPIITFGRMGTIKFHYGSRTIRMGASIYEAEARTIVEWLAQRLPATATS
jgi:hypothetical protein